MADPGDTATSIPAVVAPALIVTGGMTALLYAAMTADSARRHYTGRGAHWRGRANPTR